MELPLGDGTEVIFIPERVVFILQGDCVAAVAQYKEILESHKHLPTAENRIRSTADQAEFLIGQLETGATQQSGEAAAATLKRVAAARKALESFLLGKDSRTIDDRAREAVEAFRQDPAMGRELCRGMRVDFLPCDVDNALTRAGWWRTPTQNESQILAPTGA